MGCESGIVIKSAARLLMENIEKHQRIYICSLLFTLAVYYHFSTSFTHSGLTAARSHDTHMI